MGRVLGRTLGDRLGQNLLLGRNRLFGEGIAQAFQLGIAGPAEGCLLAAGVEEIGRDRVEHVNGAPGGQINVPTTRGWRILLGATRHQRLPVHRLQVDLEAGLFQERLGDRGQIGERGDVG